MLTKAEGKQLVCTFVTVTLVTVVVDWSAGVEGFLLLPDIPDLHIIGILTWPSRPYMTVFSLCFLRFRICLFGIHSSQNQTSSKLLTSPPEIWSPCSEPPPL